MKELFTFLVVIVISGQVFAQQETLWTDKPVTGMRIAGGQKYFPLRYRSAGLNTGTMHSLLQTAPDELDTPPSISKLILELPNPDGGLDSFRLVEYSMMEPELAARYPDFGTYRGIDIHDPFKTIRCDWTVNGFSAIVTSRDGRYHVEPFARGNQEDYLIFYKRDYPLPKEPFICGVDGETLEKPIDNSERISGDCVFRSYRLAVATTGEYSNYFGATSSADSALVMAEVVITVNRVNEVYERDVTVRLVLIANTADVFYYDGETDPFTNGSACAELPQNQTNMTNVIGGANYDIGHVFGFGGGGCASNGVCVSFAKAYGATGTNPPEGDLFYIDYVAHEIGHQFSASHTFNNSCNGNISSNNAYEPGSGSTIMAYAGVCTPNVQNNSDDYFHGRSVQQINNYISLGSGNSCDAPITFVNSAPVMTAGADYTIPISTPFMLTAIATDADGDPLTYCWEQYDNEQDTMPPLSTNDLGPLFRSFNPDPSPTRYFPRLQDLVNNISPTWEVLPSVTRAMEFRITVRDFHDGIAGCTDEDNVNVNVNANSGPFVVTDPNLSTTLWVEGENATVTWDVANTTSAPVSCANVDILLSYDGGFTYPVTLASDVTNDGSHVVVVPVGETSEARVMVRGAGNIFFDISNENFSIVTEIPVIMCSTQYSTDVPKIISSSGTPTVTSVLTSTLGGEITDVNVIDLVGTHSYLNDLRFTLTSPAGTDVVLIDQWCGSQDNFDIDLDDQAVPGAPPCPYNNGNAYQPEQPLSAFNGESPTGTWTLTVQDLVNQDGGTLNTWALEICSNIGCSHIVFSTDDSGAGTLRNALDCVSPGDTITFSSDVFSSTITLTSPLVLSTDITILSSPVQNITVDGSNTTMALQISAPTVAVVEGLTFIAGSATSGSGIQNEGDLLLKDVNINPGLLSGDLLLSNLGTLTLEGDCHISQ